MSQSDDPDDDLRWLNAIREMGTSVNESQRIGNALRKRHARMERGYIRFPSGAQQA